VIGILRLSWLIFLLASVAPETAYSQEQAQFPCRHDDVECAAKAVRGHVVTKWDYWKHAFAQPVEERIRAAPQELTEYVNLDNIVNAVPNRPRSATVPDDFLLDVRAAIAELPRKVRYLLSPRLAGIYFVENMGGTGYTDTIYDDRSNPVAGFVVLDLSALASRTANTWATWKENSPFQAQPGYTLTAVIESKRDNNRKNAIQYILLHEFGHVLAVNERFHPLWNIEPKDVPAAGSYPFFRLSWAIARDKNRYVTIFDDVFPERKDIVYYFGAKLRTDQMMSAYRNLERTNFATLYAATHPADDFAEAFASYVHTVLMKKPFEIRLYKDGKLAKSYKSCWTQQRCAEKRRVLESFLDGK
jgi:hypothetical protein